MEQPPLYGCTLEHRPFSRFEPVDASREECLDARRHGLDRGVGIVTEHGEHLLDEEWVAFRRVNDAIAECGCDPAIVHEPFDQIHRLGLVQRGKRDESRSGPRSGPRRTGVEEVGARKTEEQDRAPLEKPRTYSSRSSIAGSAQ